MNKHQKLIRLAIAALFIAFIYYISDTLVPVIISFILFYLLNPLVKFLSQKRKTRVGLSVDFAILLAFLITGIIIYLFFRFIIPPLAAEFKSLMINIPNYIESAQKSIFKLREWYSMREIPAELHNVFVQGLENIVKTLVEMLESSAKSLLGFAGQFVKLIIVPILTFYFLKDKNKIKAASLNFFPQGYRVKISKITERINLTLNSYVKGMFILCIIVGSMATLGLYLLGVKYYFILGIIAGVTEAIPIIGPWIGAVPAVMIALIYDPFLAVQVALLYIIIQVVENSLLVPKILGHHLDLHPVAIIMAILIFGKIFGAWGLFFAAPILAILNVLYDELKPYEHKGNL